MHPEAAEPELEPVEDFLASRGIESLANEPVIGHDGQPVPLYEALACGPARTSIDSIIAERRETARELGVEGIDVLPAIKRHIKTMGQIAQTTDPAPQTVGAEKK